MDPKLFYQKLSELTYWDFPENGKSARTVNIKQTTVTRALQRKLIANWQNPLERYPQLLEGQYQPEIEPECLDTEDEEDEEPQEQEDSAPPTTKIPNLSQAPRIIAVRAQPKTCEDCGIIYTERRVNSQRMYDPEPHWRHNCTACGQSWNSKNSPGSLDQQ